MALSKLRGPLASCQAHTRFVAFPDEGTGSLAAQVEISADLSAGQALRHRDRDQRGSAHGPVPSQVLESADV